MFLKRTSKSQELRVDFDTDGTVDRNIFYDNFYIAKKKMKNNKRAEEIKHIFSFIDSNIQNLLAEE